MPKHKDDPEAVDEYLSKLEDKDRQTLQEIREYILSLAPDAIQKIGYGIIVFRTKKDLVGLAKQKDHLSFYTMSPALVKEIKDEMKDVKLSGATIHFTPENPMPKALLKRIVKARIKELEPEFDICNSKNRKVNFRL